MTKRVAVRAPVRALGYLTADSGERIAITQPAVHQALADHEAHIVLLQQRASELAERNAALEQHVRELESHGRELAGRLQALRARPLWQRVTNTEPV